jgi:ATP-binding cassette subfamily F protein uup
LFLGQLQPDSGLVKLGTGLEIAYFDQLHCQLDEQKSVWENVADGYSTIHINGREKNVVGYLQDFLFTPDRARAPITRLSGGERNRLLLAKLFSKASNLLVMDEPTNDLDVETLELLEEQLADYPGTLLLVSHDRDFLDRVVTSTLVIEGEGRISEYVGGYSDWLKQRSRSASQQSPDEPAKTQPVIETKPDPRPQKLSYKLARELAALPDQVEQMEADMAELASQMNDPALHADNPAQASSIAEQMAGLQAELDQAYARWEELEALQNP